MEHAKVSTKIQCHNFTCEKSSDRLVCIRSKGNLLGHARFIVRVASGSSSLYSNFMQCAESKSCKGVRKSMFQNLAVLDKKVYMYYSLAQSYSTQKVAGKFPAIKISLLFITYMWIPHI